MFKSQERVDYCWLQQIYPCQSSVFVEEANSTYAILGTDVVSKHLKTQLVRRFHELQYNR